MAGSGRETVRNRPKPTSENDKSNYNTKPRKIKTSQDNNNLIQILAVNLKTLVGFGIIGFLAALFFIYYFIVLNYNNNNNNHYVGEMPRVVTPFPAPKIMDLPQFRGEHKESLYWGTYRPHVYLGIRARTPQSLVAGLMWIGIKDGRYFMRHVCQDGDELKTYGWTNHNGRDYGHQILVDHDLTLMTSFLKFKENGSGFGGDWALRIDAQSENSKLNEDLGGTSNIFFYLADETGNALSLGNDLLNIHENSLLTYGSRKDVGGWQLHLKSSDDFDFHYSGFKTPHIHNLSDLVQQNLGAQIRSTGHLQLSDTSDKNSNILVFQITARSSFKTDLAFISGTNLKNSRPEERLSSLTGTSLSSRLENKKKEFDDKFRKCFNLNDEIDSESISVGKAAIGNLLGGIGYFYGQSKIAVPKNSNSEENYISYWPAELYTAVPSRPFFPRGFLWDEGFHQLSIWRWDISISLDIIGHWLDLMNADGWIPREQILGAEARSKVPEEFVLQHPTNGNPPTLFLVLHDLVCAMKRKQFTSTERDQISNFLERAFVRLEAWFQWFNTTQSGKVGSSYYWHGRDTATVRELNPKSLSSGLDDYPRSSHPSEDERHLDLRCWMLLAADCMSSISEIIEDDELGKKYGSTAKMLSDFETLNKMHFDEAYGAYFDFGNHTEKVRLSWREVKVNNQYVNRELVREVMEDPKLRFVPHIGYVSLFPFMGKVIPPESPILEQQLNLISNRSILWTDYGLRSLSRTSSIYMKRNTEHDAPYWRGPIWMNMNYLILSSLHHYSKESGPYQEKAKTTYNDLRNNLIRNIVKNYQQTGYFWEQYDQKKGKGKGARLFTGWTSLILLIMAEAYPDC